MLISGVLQTTRFYKSLFVSSILFIATDSVEYGVCVFLLLTFSFAFNDYIDTSKDSVGHPHRAIPSGKISRLQGLVLSIILLILGLSVAFGTEFSFGFTLTFLGSILYSLLLKPYIPLAATFVWSATVAIAFVQPFSNEFFDYFGVMLMIYAYETVLDFRDVIADNLFCKTPTLAALTGQYSILLSIVIGIAGILVLTFL
jgi:4-hydroxybenzoate polyprenyltransferase